MGGVDETVRRRRRPRSGKALVSPADGFEEAEVQKANRNRSRSMKRTISLTYNAQKPRLIMRIPGYQAPDERLVAPRLSVWLYTLFECLIDHAGTIRGRPSEVPLSAMQVKELSVARG